MGSSQTGAQRTAASNSFAKDAASKGIAMSSGDLITSQDRVMTVMAANTEQSNKQGALMLKLHKAEMKNEEEKNRKSGFNLLEALKVRKSMGWF